MCSIGNFTRRLHAQLPRMVAAVLATAAIVYLLDNITGWRNVTNTTGELKQLEAGFTEIGSQYVSSHRYSGYNILTLFSFH